MTPRTNTHIPRWRVRVHVVKEDCWIGVFWKRAHPSGDQGQRLGEMLKVYVCVIPCLPLIVSRWTPQLMPTPMNTPF